MKHMPIQPSRRNAVQRRQLGFTLIEALVALVVVSSGLLALAGMQAGLARNADLSRQRSEAVRLAQEQLEMIRSFSQIPAVAGAFSWNNFGWESLANGNDTVTTNATYTRTWTIGGLATATQRPISVSVAWTDRAGQAQTVVLDSVISENDPAFSGSVGFPLPQNSNLKQPKNRNLNIPMPAISLGGGRSAYQIADNYAIIFSDSTGFVVKQCNTTVTAQTNLDTCGALTGYILTGYISKTISTWPNGVNLSGLTGVTLADSKCKFGVATNQNTESNLNNYYFYVCVLPVATTGDVWNTWGGTVRLSGVPTNANNIVCRFQYPDTAYINNNERNVQPYVNVNQSLDNQNYIVHSSSAGNCPSSSTTGGLQTVIHQDCRSTNANRATECPANPSPTPSS